ncbi:RsiV family protein [Butyrivibrio sp. MC2013]|uniref:RsiV family protein n=1 Tax=Butyrivibrio sp. MC2013 TaxID=1280686 RepID=UPI00041A8970|nr:RsiV family protein [Butyrivibrio sp. MC2013]
MKKKLISLFLITTLTMTSACSAKAPADGSDAAKADANSSQDGDAAGNSEEEDGKADGIEAGDSDADGASSKDDADGEAAEGSTDGEAAESDDSKGGLEDADRPLPTYITVRDFFSDYYDEDGSYTELYKGREEDLLLSADSKEDYPLLYDALFSKYMDTHKERKKAAEEEMAESRGMYEEDYFMGAFENTNSIFIKRADASVISYASNVFKYLGGAHGNGWLEPASYDVSTGKELALSDVINIDKDELNKILYDKISNYGGNFSDKEYMDSFGGLEENLSTYAYSLEEVSGSDELYSVYNWYLGFDGIHFYFAPYALASFADGDVDVVIGYKEKPEIFEEKYLPDALRSDSMGAPEGYIENLGHPFEEKMDIDGDGKDELVTLDTKYDDDYSYITGVTITIDNQSYKYTNDWFYCEIEDLRLYHVRTDDQRDYLYLQTGGMDDYWTWSVFDINKDNLKFMGDSYFGSHYEEVENGEEYPASGMPQLTDPDRMLFGEHSDMLGTFSAYGYWRVGSDGNPEIIDRRRNVNYYGEGVRCKKEIKCDLISAEGEILEKDITLKAGDVIMPVYSDLDSYVDCTLSDGRMIRLNYSEIGYPAKIDGVSVDDLFDNLMYAG